MSPETKLTRVCPDKRSVASPAGAVLSTNRKLEVPRHPSLAAERAQAAGRSATMQVVYTRCCGIDVHKASVTACVLVTGAEGQVTEQVRTFGTMTGPLRQLSAWLTEQQVEGV